MYGRLSTTAADMSKAAILILLLVVGTCVCGQAQAEGDRAQSYIVIGDGGWEYYHLDEVLTAADFVDANTGWVGTSSGVILKTTNGGKTWSAQATGRRGWISRLQFVDASTGWATVASMQSEPGGCILRTTDGGVTWAVTELPGFNPTASHFLDSSQGWLVGDDFAAGWDRAIPVILKTTDGGRTWRKEHFGAGTGQMHSVFFIDSEHGWVVANSAVLTTKDGGLTWAPIPGTKGGESGFFLDADTGWVVRRATASKTTDGGKNWTPQVPVDPMAAVGSVGFADAQTGWAVGTSGIISRTTDGGRTWTHQAGRPGDDFLVVLDVVDANTAWAMGSRSMVRTVDGGSTWSSVYPGSHDMTNSAICFIDAKTGWKIGVRTVTDPEMRVTSHHTAAAKTVDGGLTWTALDDPDVFSEGRSVQFVDGEYGWVLTWPYYEVGKRKDTVGDKEHQSVSATVDGGALWFAYTLPTKNWINGMRFANRETGWVVGNKGTILNSTDGGVTWMSQICDAPMDLRAVYPVSPSVIYVSGDNGLILKSVDGGKKWTRQTTMTGYNLNALQFLDEKTGWAAGEAGMLLTTEDGGSTWTRYPSRFEEDIIAIHFLNKDEGYSTGRSTAVYRTADGGRTWQCQAPGGRYGFGSAIAFTDPSTGIGAGPYTVAHTATAGLPGCVWIKNQPDGETAAFGHLVVTSRAKGHLYAEHPDSRLGIRINSNDTDAVVGDYIYVRGKVSTLGQERVIDAESITVITAGWGILPPRR